MPQIVTSLTSLLPAITAGGQIASGASNIYQGYENQQYQDKLRSLAQNPQKLNAYEQQFVQPMNAGLTQGVENQAQGYAAERGLGESPALTQEIVAQAIAPYIQQNQQSGYSSALQALGLGGGAQPSSTSAGLSQLFSGLGGLGSQASLQHVLSLANQGGNVDTIPSNLGTLIQPESTPGLNDFFSSNFGGGA